MDSLAVTAGDGTRLHVGVTGHGPDVLVLSGGPGCVHYLEDDHLAPRGFRSWFPEPRGVGRSSGGPHTMQQAVADLEAVRQTVEAASWMVLGHSWGCDLAVRYALDHPRSVRQVIGVAGHGLHQDRSWSQIYQELKHTEPDVPIAWDPAVHEALQASFREWIHEPALFRRLADSPVPMSFISAAEDVRPSWPLQQLGELVPNGSFQQIPGVPHDLWATHPDEWVDVVTTACRRTIA